MKLFLKTGILLLILAIPVLIYLFLQGFGSNQYTIPVYYENGVPSSMQDCSFSSGQHFIPDFELITQDSTRISEKILEKNITVVDFFFTSCPDICPEMSTQLGRVQGKYQEEEKVQILSFSVDPAYDTPEVLKTYANRFDAQPGKWQFATGDKKAIYALARCGFLLPVQEGDGGATDFIHSEKLILVDGNKRIRGYYDGTDREDVDRLITEINILLSQKEG